METIIAAAVAGAFALIGTVVTVKHNNQKILQEMKTEFTKEMHEMKAEFAKAQAVTECQMEELTREVREHNNFAKRMPALEQKVEGIDEKIHIYHSN